MPPNTPVLQALQPNETPNPAEVLRQWPAGTPLAVRWSALPDTGTKVIVGIPAETRTARTGPELESLLRGLQPRERTPHRGGWFGWISYDAGECFEPASRAATPRALADRLWPLASFHRIESPVELDDRAAKSGGVGPASEILKAMGTRRDPDRDRDSDPHYTLDPIDAAKNRDQYIAGVHRIIEYIRAGDAYQVNLAHRLSTPFSGSPRGLFADLVEAAQPWHGGYFEADGYALASLSPELFLEADLHTGEVRTRPMKGTRPYTDATDAAARLDLDSSAKDRAELAMIVDLMRNDLGRVCDLGSVRVEQERRIEKHASGVLQSTATVAGRLRRGTTLLDLLRATFPPGSVTGAPKIRAMQIIDELEPVRRGPYCGTMMWIGDDGKLEANVMIRTACISSDPGSGAGNLDYSVGAGIVVDSDPASEWSETLVKAGMVLERPRQLMHQAAKRAEA
jgi:para-aminobenzoate synthetase component 1